MKLSERLQAIADEIKPGETMADIGTDHGFLPVALVKRGTCPRALMADVSEAALAKAIRFGTRHGIQDPAAYRLGDGLSVLAPGETDAVVLAGMGALLMIRILSEDPAKTASFSKFILQPRNYPHLLRKWLWEADFGLLEDNLVREGRRICEILTVAPRKPGRIPWPAPPWEPGDIRWEVPPWYARPGEKIYEDYLAAKAERETRVLGELMNQKKPSEELLRQRTARRDYLLGLMKGESHD